MSQPLPTHVEFRASNGVRIAGLMSERVSRNATPATDAVRILAVHGWLDNAETFSPMTAALLDRVQKHSRASLLAIDFPGHGLSDPLPLSQTYFAWDHALAILDVAKAVRWPRFVLIGHSMGGSVAVLFASAFPEMVSDLIVIESLGHVNRFPKGQDAAVMREFMEARRAINLQMAEDDSVEVLKSKNTFPTLEEAARARMEGVVRVSFQAAMMLAKRGVDEAPGGGFRWNSDKRLKARHFWRWDHEGVEDQLRAITARILVVMGDDSNIFKSADALVSRRIQILKEERPASEGNPVETRVEWISGGTHHLHLEQETAGEVARTVAEFLSL
ncbi:Alpha/Beta hydrolase protein [Chytriomyces sp. MP71]|nr:Alpha/Beta hydrolase protein [Chytriomyces sp. MP71]